MSLEKTPTINPLSLAFLEAAQQAGFALLTFNIDGELREGVGVFQLNARNGLRQSSAQAYIHPMLPSAHNLTLLTNTVRLGHRPDATAQRCGSRSALFCSSGTPLSCASSWDRAHDVYM